MATAGSTVKKASPTVGKLRTINTLGGGTVAAAGGPAAGGPLDPSNLEIENIGWHNLEAKYNELKALLSAPTTGLNAQEARIAQKQTVSAAIATLLDNAQRECRKLLIDGHAKAAVEGGLKTLRLKENYYGQGSTQLVPVYFHLARTNQYMDKFKAAEEFLSLAQWIILKNPPAADVSLKAELHQTLGLLYASDAKLDAALKQLTCATYYLSVMNGPEHILTSFGYFDLGNVFAAKSNMENAMAFYDKVKEIWYRHLTLVLGERASGAQAVTPYATPQELGMENMQDVAKMLRGIVGLQTERFGAVHPSVCRAELVLGLFFIFNYDDVTAQSYLLRAYEIAKRVYGPRHQNTLEIRDIIERTGLQVPEDTSFALLEEPKEPESGPNHVDPARNRPPSNQ